MKLTGVDVGEEDEGPFVEGQQGIKHQPVDLDGLLDVSGNRVLQSHYVVSLLHFVTCNMNRHLTRDTQTHSDISHYISAPRRHPRVPSQLLMMSM